jgi:geranylgeranyl diphosphate synthase, type II
MTAPTLVVPEVEEELARYRSVVAAALESDLPRGEPTSWLYDLVAEYPGRDGKGLRPALCLATTEAFDGRPAEAVPSAVAIELLHNAFLVHDDIEDESELRRGRPTLHAEHGVPLALNAGDALAILGLGPLRRNAEVLGPRLAARIADEFVTMARYTLEGQAIELGWIRDRVEGLTPEDYLGLIMRKTCWYTTIHPLRIGLLVGTLGAGNPDRMVDFGFHLGAAFQIRDDVLNLVGDESLYGKEILGDVLEGKRTLLLIHLLAEAGGADRAFLDGFLARSRHDRTREEAERVRELMVAHGSLAFAEEYARLFALRAEDSYGHAFGVAANTAAGRFVRRLIGYMLERRS